jgi:hypothetical protein
MLTFETPLTCSTQCSRECGKSESALSPREPVITHSSSPIAASNTFARFKGTTFSFSTTSTSSSESLLLLLLGVAVDTR